MQKESDKGIKKQKLETPSEWGHSYSEFKGDGLGAINKLLETKKGFVAGAFHKEGLGDIDLVWGNKDYGLEHILKCREKQAKNKGLNEQQAKEYALNIAKTIPEAIDKGVKVDNNGRIAIEYNGMRVGLNDKWDDQKLENKWVISSYELYDTEKQALRSTPQAITKEKAFNSLNSVEPNSNTKKLNKE